MDKAVEEVLCMYPLGDGTASCAIQGTDVTIAGVHIPAESKVLVGYRRSCSIQAISTTRKFHIRRALKPHLAFSYWPHYCIGLALASLELKAVFGTIFSASPRCAWPWRPKNLSCARRSSLASSRSSRCSGDARTPPGTAIFSAVCRPAWRAPDNSAN
ncbi:cytochrome P450 [Rhizobium laguerreae]|nr:cytochrome P450 [Rhizobium laguerreae]